MALHSLIAGIRDFQLVYVSLRLGIPTLLADGPKPLVFLADATGVPEERLVRLLRGLLWAEIIRKTEAGFGLTDEGETLVDASPGSLAGDLLFQGHFFYASWGHLHEFVVSGRNPYEEAHGQKVFDQIGASPELARLFNRSMSVRTVDFSNQIAELPVFAGCRTVVDVAGGEGRLAVDILHRHSRMRGIVFDLPVAREDAERLIEGEALASRCTFVAGDLFGEVPSGGDVYVLKWILHDWDDPHCLRILRNVRAAMGMGGRLVVVERVMPEAIKEGVVLAEADLNMLCLNGGAERTESAMTALLAQSGFAVEGIEALEDDETFHAFTARREPDGA